MNVLHRLFRRNGEDDARVPAMDGVFKPNALLDAAERVLALPGIDNLAVADDSLLCTSGDMLYRVDPATRAAVELHRFGGIITMVAVSPAGRVAVGIEGRGLEVGSAAGGWHPLEVPEEYRSCLTAGAFRGEAELVVTVGSLDHSWSDWKRDLMGRGASGGVVVFRLPGGSPATLADGLAFPYGVALAGDRLVVAESWRHRLLALPGQEVRLEDLPAYPARLAPATGGGFWLALFAPRRQITEFVLREDDYRREMMDTIPPEAWIGPDFGDGGGPTEPLQSGSVRQMGIMKPWAPSRSYGLVVRLDRDLAPVATFHSRADGRIHGIASLVEMAGRLYAAARGAGLLVAFDAATGERQ